MIAVRIVPPDSDFGRKYTPMGRRLIVKEFFIEGTWVPPGGPSAGNGLLFHGVPDSSGLTWGWVAENFRPLDDGDIQGLREKYGELVSGKKEGVE
jgi:hypothetical protein